jgi:hypothetical protein
MNNNTIVSEEIDINLYNNNMNPNPNPNPEKKYHNFTVKIIEEFKKIINERLETYFDLPYILTHPTIFVRYDNNNSTYNVFDTVNKIVCFIELSTINNIKQNYNIIEDVPNVFELGSTIDFEIVGLTDSNKIPIEIKIETKLNKDKYKIIKSIRKKDNTIDINNTCIYMYLCN